MTDGLAAFCGGLIGGTIGVALFWLCFRLWDAR